MASIEEILLSDEEEELEETFNKVKELYRQKISRINRLRKENEELLNEHFKDEKLSEMQHRLETMQKSYYSGFPIEEAEKNAIEEWKKKHDEEDHKYTPEMRIRAEGCCGGRYKYVFVPTSIGTVGKIVCHCGAEFVFQDIT